MSRESNYFEEAYQLCHDRDSFVSETAKTLYEQMRICYTQSGLAPRAGFNILYFFQSVIRLLLTNRPDITISSTQYPYPCEPIRAVNCPNGLDGMDQGSELWRKYIELVNAESIPAGDDFDVGYAISILSSATGNDGALERPRVETKDEESEFDEWLAGFNRNED